MPGEEGFVEICRHIATHAGRGDFGRFPHRFPNNISRKSRSSYLGNTKGRMGGVAAGKTHALTNEQSPGFHLRTRSRKIPLDERRRLQRSPLPST